MFTLGKGQTGLFGFGLTEVGRPHTPGHFRPDRLSSRGRSVAFIEAAAASREWPAGCVSTGNPACEDGHVGPTRPHSGHDEQLRKSIFLCC